MKRLTRLLPLALLCLAGCTSDEIESNGRVDDSVQVLKAVIEQREANTRMNVVEPEAGSDIWKLTWTAGDTFAGFDATGVSYDYTLYQGDNEEEAQFMGPVAELNYVAYPSADEPSLSGSVLTVSLPATFEYSDAKGIGIPMYGQVTEGAAIGFHHLGGVLRILVEDLPAESKSVTLAASQPVSGSFTANLGDMEPVLASVSTTPADLSVKVTFNKATTKVVYVPIPAQFYESIDVTLNNGTEDLHLVTWSNKTVGRGKIYTTSLTYEEIEEELEEGELFTPEMVTEKMEQKESNMEAATEAPSVKTFTFTVKNEMTNSEEDESKNEITIPDALADNNLVLNLQKTPEGTSEENPLVLTTENNSDDTKEDMVTGQLTLNIPQTSTTESGDAPVVVVDTPEASVKVTGQFMKLTAHTAINTLKLGEGIEIGTLVIKGGNIEISTGAVIDILERHPANTATYTYIHLRDKSMENMVRTAIAAGEGDQNFVVNTIPYEEYETLRSFSEGFGGIDGWNDDTFVENWPGLTLSNGTLTALNLAGKGLSGQIPESIEKFTYLTTLDLSNNQLTGGLPQSILKLIYLSKLDLRGNRLTEEVPESIWRTNVWKGISEKYVGPDLTFENAVTSIEIAIEMSIMVGYKHVIGEMDNEDFKEVIITPEDAVNSKIGWRLTEDSPRGIISITEDGTMKALKFGEAIMEAYLKENTSSDHIVVSNPCVVKVVQATTSTDTEEFEGENKEWDK